MRVYVCAGAHEYIAQGHVYGVLMNGITIISNSIKTNDFEMLITFTGPSSDIPARQHFRLNDDLQSDKPFSRAMVHCSNG